MRPKIQITYLVLGFTLFGCLFFAPIFGQTGQTKTATIKKKDGEVIKGEIKGTVVQGESGPVSTGSRTGYGALYYTPKGEQIEAIDEEGVHYRVSGRRVRFVNIGQKDKINDSEAAGVAVAMDGEGSSNPVFDYSISHGMAAVLCDVLEVTSPTRLKILGEYRKDGKLGKIIPALEVATAKGMVSIPIEEIVEFKKVTEKPKQ